MDRSFSDAISLMEIENLDYIYMTSDIGQYFTETELKELEKFDKLHNKLGKDYYLIFDNNKNIIAYYIESETDSLLETHISTHNSELLLDLMDPKGSNASVGTPHINPQPFQAFPAESHMAESIAFTTRLPPRGIIAPYTQNNPNLRTTGKRKL